MDFHYSPGDEAFRSELRTWLEANAPQASSQMDDPFMEDNLEEWQRRREWHRRMHAAGWVGISWPKEYGGRGATLTQSLIYEEELSRVRTPRLLNGLGIALVGPTLIHWGTEEQKKRYIPKILSAEEIWCQGYSEPGSGSDVASLRTSAVDDGDYFVVNGQKVWTSDAHHADMCILLVRTDPGAPKHQGISYILVDMHSPGVVVRPLVQITGESGFNEVFFEDVRVPKAKSADPPRSGWLAGLGRLKDG
jgi:alkylation response protein AidB-like acyl-CoA dehydrogenase